MSKQTTQVKKEEKVQNDKQLNLDEKKLLLEVKDLHTTFYLDQVTVPAVSGVDFNISKGRTLGVVGESGCGKSVTAQSIMRIIPDPPGKIEKGEILYHKLNNGSDEVINLTSLPANGSKIRSIRGGEIAMIFQEPMNSLSPVHTIGNQLNEAILLHQEGVNKEEATQKSIEMLTRVEISKPDQRINEIPSQLSGGMRQRVMIAMALSCNPSLLIADEPTTAVDVTIQAQILDLLKELKDEFGMSIIIITHDLGVIAEMVEEVLVMYLGKVMEKADVDSLFYNPLHPYTKLLLKSIPGSHNKGKRLAQIEGEVPAPYEVKQGCPFYNRCLENSNDCFSELPEMVEAEEGHLVRCNHNVI